VALIVTPLPLAIELLIVVLLIPSVGGNKDVIRGGAVSEYKREIKTSAGSYNWSRVAF